ncbi:hypothetical protein FRB99_004418 [Tulasnella sp. 403]|nr:hypothetical protein FRB99_004418 [Tulasnella sp. 403]
MSTQSDSQASSQLKRKASVDDIEPPPKKTKGGEFQSTLPASGSQGGSGSTKRPAKQPTNATIPTNLSLPSPTPGTVKISSWNVAGLRAAQKKGFKIYVEAEKPDILVLTETKMNERPVDLYIDSQFKYRYWNIAVKKGYAGTAVFSKIEPIKVTYTLPDVTMPDMVKGRLVILEFETCFLVCTYVPNAGQGLKNMEGKVEWQRAFEKHVRDLDTQKPVIWAGDINVAPTEKDLTNPKSNWNRTAGYTAIECSWYANFLNPKKNKDSAGTSQEEDGEAPPAPGKFFDVWRKRNPTVKHFSYFSFLRSCREKGIGWRLDMFTVSERIYARVKTCEIRDEVYGASDHVPIIMEIEGDL